MILFLAKIMMIMIEKTSWLSLYQPPGDYNDHVDHFDDCFEHQDHKYYCDHQKPHDDFDYDIDHNDLNHDEGHNDVSSVIYTCSLLGITRIQSDFDHGDDCFEHCDNENHFDHEKSQGDFDVSGTCTCTLLGIMRIQNGPPYPATFMIHSLSLCLRFDD